MLNSSTCSLQISLRREESFLGLKDLCSIDMSALHLDNYLIRLNTKVNSEEKKLSSEKTFHKSQKKKNIRKIVKFRKI